MSELTREPCMIEFAELTVRVPKDKLGQVRVALENVLELLGERYSVTTAAGSAEESESRTYPLEEVFPDLHAGHALRGLRLREELTQKALAAQIGVKPSHISEMESGKRPIGKEMAKRLAEVLRTEYRVFL